MTSNDAKLLQAILDGQKALETRLSEKIDKLDQKVEKNGKRIDNLGKQLAYLEDDAPTREEFDGLDKRVTKLEAVV